LPFVIYLFKRVRILTPGAHLNLRDAATVQYNKRWLILVSATRSTMIQKISLSAFLPVCFYS